LTIYRPLRCFRAKARDTGLPIHQWQDQAAGLGWLVFSALSSPDSVPRKG